MTYIINTTALLYKNIEEVGAWLKKYQITLDSLSVWNIWEDGSKHRNDPAARTIKQVAGSFATSGGITAVGGAALAAILPALPILPLLAGLLADIKLLHRSNKLYWDGKTISCEVRLSFGNVTADRRKWAEYLLGAFCELHGWLLHKPSASAASGARYAARVGHMPPAWETSQTEVRR